MTFTFTLNCLRAELRDITSSPHKLATLRHVLKISVLLNELEDAHSREVDEARRETLIEQHVADVISIFGRHDVD